MVVIPKESSSADEQNNIRDEIVKDLADPTNLYESKFTSLADGTLFVSQRAQKCFIFMPLGQLL